MRLFHVLSASVPGGHAHKRVLVEDAEYADEPDSYFVLSEIDESTIKYEGTIEISGAAENMIGGILEETE